MRAILMFTLLLFGQWTLAAAKASPRQVAVAAAPTSSLKSYRDWKNEKIQNAQKQIDQTKAQVQALKARPPVSFTKAAIESLEQELSQEEWNLEIARDLAVTDYLVLYLAQQGTHAKLAEAAGKLTPEETAQILEAYIRTTGALPTSTKILIPANATQTR